MVRKAMSMRSSRWSASFRARSAFVSSSWRASSATHPFQSVLSKEMIPPLRTSRGQRERHAERRVAGEDPHLDRAPRAEKPGEERHELSLVGRDLHAAVLDAGGLLAQLALHRVLTQRMRQEVLVEGVGDCGGLGGHGGMMTHSIGI